MGQNIRGVGHVPCPSLREASSSARHDRFHVSRDKFLLEVLGENLVSWLFSATTGCLHFIAHSHFLGSLLIPYFDVTSHIDAVPPAFLLQELL